MFKQVILCTMSLILLSGCTSLKNQQIDTLNFYIVPSVTSDELKERSNGFDELLKEELAKEGYIVDNVNVVISDTYEETGEAIRSGEADIALLPSGMYVDYRDKGAKLALTAERNRLNVDSEDPKDWNAQENSYNDGLTTYYRSLILAGPSETGKDLINTVNNDKELSYDDLAEAKWCTQSDDSSAGYLYPSLWLYENFNHYLNDIPNQVHVNGYYEAIDKLMAGECDIAPIYADARVDYAELYDENIWSETNVIGVSRPILNDTISVSTRGDYYSADFLNAVQSSFINIAETKEGQEMMGLYRHADYQIGNDADYDSEEIVQEKVAVNT